MIEYFTRALSLVLLISFLAGCEATAEDIERWKGTQRGPAKITAVVVDDRYPYELRGRAAVALVEIVQWDHFNAAFQALSDQERQGVIHAMIPRLVEMYNSGAGGESPTDEQVNAKDAMADLYALAAEEDRRAMDEPLIHWITSDFNSHYLPGRRAINVIVENMGATGATALATILTPQNAIVSEKIAQLIVEHGDEESKQVASTELAKTATKLGAEIRPSFWKAMAQICGEPIRRFTLEFAAHHEGDVESQSSGIICVLGKGVAGCGDGCTRPDDLDAIIAIAEDEAQDERIRAAAYDAIRDHGTPEYAERFLKMIDDRDARYRATGIDLAIHLGGAKLVVDALERIGASRESWPWKHKSIRTGDQEYGLCNMGLGQLEQAEGIHDVLVSALSHRSPYVRAGSANMLGIVGTEEDIASLERITNDRAKVKGWVPGKVGAQAEQAIERIRDPNRPADPSARRGKACGLNVM